MQNQKQFYDDIYSRKGDSAMRPKIVYERWFKLLGQTKPNQKLTDIGCGTGRFLQVAAENKLETYGLDISDEAVKVSLQNSPSSKIVQGSGENLPWPDNNFDYVTCLGSLEHFDHPDIGLKEIIRVAKDEAKFLIILPNENYFFWKFKKIKKGTAQRDFEELKDLNGWKYFLNKAELEIIKVKQDKYPCQELKIFEYKNPYRILRRLAYKLIWLFMPLKYTYQFVFICRKK